MLDKARCPRCEKIYYDLPNQSPRQCKNGPCENFHQGLLYVIREDEAPAAVAEAERIVQDSRFRSLHQNNEDWFPI